MPLARALYPIGEGVSMAVLFWLTENSTPPGAEDVGNNTNVARDDISIETCDLTGL